MGEQIVNTFQQCTLGLCALLHQSKVCVPANSQGEKFVLTSWFIVVNLFFKAEASLGFSGTLSRKKRQVVEKFLASEVKKLKQVRF